MTKAFRYPSSFSSYCQASPSGNFSTTRHGMGSMKCASPICCKFVYIAREGAPQLQTEQRQRRKHSDQISACHSTKRQTAHIQLRFSELSGTFTHKTTVTLTDSEKPLQLSALLAYSHGSFTARAPWPFYKPLFTLPFGTPISLNRNGFVRPILEESARNHTRHCLNS